MSEQPTLDYRTLPRPTLTPEQEALGIAMWSWILPVAAWLVVLFVQSTEGRLGIVLHYFFAGLATTLAVGGSIVGFVALSRRPMEGRMGLYVMTGIGTVISTVTGILLMLAISGLWLRILLRLT